MHQRDRSPVAPVYLTTLFLLLAYPAKLLAVRMSIGGVNEEFEGRLFDNDAVAFAMWMLVTGLAAYYVGYYWTPGVFQICKPGSITTLHRDRPPLVSSSACGLSVRMGELRLSDRGRHVVMVLRVGRELGSQIQPGALLFI